MTLDSDVVQHIRARLGQLYRVGVDACLDKISRAADRHTPLIKPRKTKWDEQDVVLITYADQVRQSGITPLESLRTFLLDHELNDLIQCVHLLPFFPFSSDDGFSVIDYRAVNPDFGSWDDIDRLGEQFDLAFDLVVNHISQHSAWFQSYLAGQPPYADYFIEADPDNPALALVTRPRSLPLISQFASSRGPLRVWTTFSEDQIDLNYANPEVLAEMLDVLLMYIARGARIVRLDAIAYLWKQIGTNCIHLPQTHAVVKLMREIVDGVAPGTLLLTETNVPHEENISYLGNGDEAHMIYQFSLAPLLLDAFYNQDATILTDWLETLDDLPRGTTYFNFTASHDGVGVRPAEGLLPPERFDKLVESARARGARVNTRRTPDGTDVPYELCMTYFDALGEPDQMPPDLHAGRFLTSQAIMLALRGIPGIYFHSLVGTPNDVQGAEQTGQHRSINRRKFDRAEIDAKLADADTAQARVFAGYKRLLAVRQTQPAFHPDAAQEPLRLGHPALFGFARVPRDPRHAVLVVANLGGQPEQVDLASCGGESMQFDLIGNQPIEAKDGKLSLQPYQTVWLVAN